MSRKGWIGATLVCAASLFSSCENLFNPSGETSLNELDADGLISQGELYLRQGKNYDAYQAFDQAIKLDSSKSMAYYGKAKASLRRYNVNPIELMKVISETQSNPDTPPLTVIGNYVIQKLRDSSGGFGKAVDTMSAALAPFYRRDSINELWVAWDKSKGKATLTETEKKNATLFENEYVLSKNAYKLEQFPIMDGKLKANRLLAERNVGLAVSMMQSVNKLFAGYDNIEDITAEITDLASGTKDLSETKIFQTALQDSNMRNSLNENIEALSKDASKLSTIAGSFSQITGTDQAKVDSAAADTALQSQVEKLGSSINFYKIADNEDNDGDGCVDEEIYDLKDNDGDGLVDEDIRGSLAMQIDFKDNDKDGSIDNALELITADSLFAFTLSPSFVKGPEYTNKDLKLSYALDSTFSKYPLSERKIQIGACWRNYK